VTYDAEMVKKIAEKFMRDQNSNNVNKEHKDPVDGVFMFETFLKDSSRGISAPKGFEDLPEGTWFGSYKVYNNDIWSQVKDGTFKGFSVEGEFLHVSHTENFSKNVEITTILDEIISLL
jgi:hypothetical protein